VRRPRAAPWIPPGRLAKVAVMKLSSATGITPAALALALTMAAPLSADAAPDVTAQLDALLAPQFAADQPGAAVLVRKGDRVLLRKAYGMADLAKARPVQPDMVFRLGSITKQFTATAIMILVDEGKLSVGDDIRKHLPGYPTHDATITVEHLLTHTSGIPSYTELPGFPQRMAQDIEPAALVEQFKNLPLEFPPGTRMKYSNSGYHLLGLIIEKVSGLGYADFIARRIFAPLGMTHSGYGDDPRLDRALGYNRGAQGPARMAPPISMKIPYAGGGLVSSVDDLARWDSAIRAGKLLKKATWQRVFTPGRLADGSRTDYGYGWSIGKIDGRPAQSHGGGIPGFVSHILRVPEQGLLVVLLLNSIPGPGDPGLLAHRLALTTLGKPLVDPAIAKVDATVLARYAGVYQIQHKGKYLVRLDRDHLTVQTPRGPTLSVWPESERRFFVKDNPLRFAFTSGPDGAVTEMAVTRINGEIERAARTTEALPPERAAIALPVQTLDRYVGEYRMNPLFSITVTRSGSQLFAQATNQPQLEIFASAPNEFFLRAVDAQLTFQTPATGPASQLVLSQNGQKLTGKRVR
jgi:D-alanyl-D-alanine carboxypeptidase